MKILKRRSSSKKKKKKKYLHSSSSSSSSSSAARELQTGSFHSHRRETFHNIPGRNSRLVFMELGHWSTDAKLRYWDRFRKAVRATLTAITLFSADGGCLWSRRFPNGSPQAERNDLKITDFYWLLTTARSLVFSLRWRTSWSSQRVRLCLFGSSKLVKLSPDGCL